MVSKPCQDRFLHPILVQFNCLFVLLGSALIKAARKRVGEIVPLVFCRSWTIYHLILKQITFHFSCTICCWMWRQLWNMTLASDFFQNCCCYCCCCVSCCCFYDGRNCSKLVLLLSTILYLKKFLCIIFTQIPFFLILLFTFDCQRLNINILKPKREREKEWKTTTMGKVTNIEYGNIDFEKVNFESLISTRL